MNYIAIYSFLEDPEGSWREVIKKNLDRYKHSLFSEMKGTYFLKNQNTNINYQYVLDQNNYPFPVLPDNNVKNNLFVLSAYSDYILNIPVKLSH